ncbi:MAG: LysM peptidoglycan-binding domain-containing protein [Mycobacteriales bacterium]
MAATVALLGLLAGPPAVLVLFVGSPGPHAAPTLAGLGRALSAPLAAGTVLKFVAVLGWLAWAHLLWCVAAEVRAELSERPARRVPLGGVSQQLAHRLVVSVLIAVGVGPTLAATSGHAAPVVLTRASAPAAFAAATRAVAPGRSPHSPPPAECSTTSAAHPETAAGPVGPVPPGGAQGLRVYVVAPPHGRWHDNLWDIAERHLGDGQRWREIYNLNEGRLQPDGGRLTRASLIRPGWVLLMPADATGLPLAHTPPTIPRQPQPKSATAAATPPEPTSAPAADPSVAATLPSRTQPHPPEPATASVRSAGSPGPISPAGVGLGIGVGLGLAAAAATLRRAAVSAQHHRRRGRRPRPQPPVAAAIGQAADALAPAADRVRQAVRLAAARAPDGATIRAAFAHPGGATDVLFTEAPGPPPAPFTEPEPGRWRLAADAAPFTYATESDPDPAPALAPLGRLADADVFLNLEAVGLLSLTGPAAQTAAIAAGIAVGLTGAPWADLAHVHTPAGLLPDLPGVDRLDTVNLEADQLAQLLRYADRVRDELSGSATPTLAAARTAGDATTMLLVLAGLPADALPAELAAAGRDPMALS